MLFSFHCSDYLHAVRIEPREVDEIDEELLANLDKKLRDVRDKAIEQRKIEAARREGIRSRQESSAANRARKQENKQSQDNTRSTNKGTDSEASWYLTKTGQVPNANKAIASGVKQPQANGKPSHAQEATREKRDALGGDVQVLDGSTHSRNNGKESNYHLLDTLEQMLQGIVNTLTSKQSKKAKQNKVSPTPHGNTKPGTHRWTTPTLVEESAQTGSRKPHGPLLHRPVGGPEVADVRKPTPMNKAGSQTGRKLKKNTIRGRYVSAKTAALHGGSVVKMENTGRQVMKKPTTGTEYANAKPKPWLARPKMEGKSQNTAMKATTLLYKDHSAHPRPGIHGNFNRMQSQQRRLVKREVESRN